MPRKARIDGAEAVHHLMVRGITPHLRDHVARLFNLAPDVIVLPGKYPVRIAARSVFCYFPVRELHMSAGTVAGRLGIGRPAVGIAVKRGETIVREKGYNIG